MGKLSQPWCRWPRWVERDGSLAVLETLISIFQPFTASLLTQCTQVKVDQPLLGSRPNFLAVLAWTFSSLRTFPLFKGEKPWLGRPILSTLSAQEKWSVYSSGGFTFEIMWIFKSYQFPSTTGPSLFHKHHRWNVLPQHRSRGEQPQQKHCHCVRRAPQNFSYSHRDRGIQRQIYSKRLFFQLKWPLNISPQRNSAYLTFEWLLPSCHIIRSSPMEPLTLSKAFSFSAVWIFFMSNVILSASAFSLLSAVSWSRAAFCFSSSHWCLSSSSCCFRWAFTWRSSSFSWWIWFSISQITWNTEQTK